MEFTLQPSSNFLTCKTAATAIRWMIFANMRKLSIQRKAYLHDESKFLKQSLKLMDGYVSSICKCLSEVPIGISGKG